MQFKVGDKVRNKYNGRVGKVHIIPREREMSDCLIVHFPDSDGVLRSLDGYTILKSQCEKVD